ncbi:hypothetical protein RRG08_059237 [Elysia crispata]|uniref:Uncharacterized protein n=1 Tax=Elysia crispata TaxID=231223 RepID=A0AAE1DET9_9GAST|nr:hypothetical protein RRG08_059237 [Elysia crispata]
MKSFLITVIDYCETSRDASFTGEVSLEGNNRQGWVTTNPQNYEQTSVVTRISKNTEGCLPFVFRVRSDKHTLMANTLYDVKLGISDQKALDRLNVDISDCVLYDNNISG